MLENDELLRLERMSPDSGPAGGPTIVANWASKTWPPASTVVMVHVSVPAHRVRRRRSTVVPAGVCVTSMLPASNVLFGGRKSTTCGAPVSRRSGNIALTRQQTRSPGP